MTVNTAKDVKSIRSTFESEIARHSPALQALARHAYAQALKYGYPYVRDSKAKTKDGETIFKHDETHVFFLVVNTKSHRIKIVTEDKTGFIDAAAFGLEPMARTQGERKKGLQVILEEGNDDVYREIVADLVKQTAFSNLAYHVAKGSTNSTDYFAIMFGAPLGSNPLWWTRFSNESLAAAMQASGGRCTKCGSDHDLELGLERDCVFTVCKGCHPNPSSFARISDAAIPYEVRKAVWHRDGGACHVPDCRSRRDNIQFDHVIPRSLGGSNTENNLVLKCRSHNLRKGNKEVVWC